MDYSDRGRDLHLRLKPGATYEGRCSVTQNRAGGYRQSKQASPTINNCSGAIRVLPGIEMGPSTGCDAAHSALYTYALVSMLMDRYLPA